MSTVSPALKICLGLLDVWPGVSYSIPYWLIFIFSMLIIQYFQYRYLLEHFKISQLSLDDSLPATLDYSLTIFKLVIFWMHRRVIHELVTAMDNDWHECIGSHQHLYTMTITANMSHFVSNTLLSFNVIVAVFYISGDYVIHSVFLTTDYNDTLRQLPMKMQLPFDTQQSPMFEFLVVTLILHVAIHSCTIAVLNGLILTLVLHVSGQIDIMCDEFKNISKSAILHEPTVPLFQVQIERHNRIISFSEKIEKLFSFIALMQVIWNTLVVCCIGFFFIMSFHNETSILVIMKTVLAYVAIMGETFIICSAGEYLSFKGKLIANATYETLWYEMPSRQIKIIVFIIMRSQKQLAITAGKMMDMSFESFASIIKASVSYISVLNAVY